MSMVKYVFISLAILVALRATNGCECKRSLYLTNATYVHSLIKNANKDNFNPITISLDGIVPHAASEVIVFVTVSDRLYTQILRYII